MYDYNMFDNPFIFGLVTSTLITFISYIKKKIGENIIGATILACLRDKH